MKTQLKESFLTKEKLIEEHSLLLKKCNTFDDREFLLHIDYLETKYTSHEYITEIINYTPKLLFMALRNDLDDRFNDGKRIRILEKYKVDKYKTLTAEEIRNLPSHESYRSASHESYIPSSGYVVGNLSILSYFFWMLSFGDNFYHFTNKIRSVLTILLKNYKIDEDGRDNLELKTKNQYYYIELIVSKYNSLRYENLMLYLINTLLKKGAKLKTKSNSSSLLNIFITSLKHKINESDSFIFPDELLNFLIKNSSPLNYKIIDSLVSFLLTHNRNISAFILKNNQYIKNTISQNISSILDTIKEE
jgi:hypothetical protein